MDPTIRKLLVEEMKGRAYINWLRINIKDYVGAARCFRCQRYGHVAKHCTNKEQICGHCANTGHTIKECPSRQEPPKCAACSHGKKENSHSINSKKCKTFLAAARKEIGATDYGNR